MDIWIAQIFSLTYHIYFLLFTPHKQYHILTEMLYIYLYLFLKITAQVLFAVLRKLNFCMLYG